MRFSVNWMDGFGNNPRFQIHDVEPPKDAPIDMPLWTQRDGIHRHDEGIWVHYFYNDMSGKPTHGFGGAVFQGTFVDGKTFTYVGAWSSRPGCVNQLWPDSRIVGVDTDRHLHTAVLACALIDWWKQARPDFGLAWCTHNNGEIYLEPTRGGQVKNPSYWDRVELVGY